eukprot:TRINITY_DN1723_c0_g1_i6.p2 TRINITY_DN1723_c0_g1~~TRINITY_DN1723_c0_g1_i6.p2  ORF type:complete len:130 (-),score=16.57 TRINITY_DN1723_c0_g1_i6:679-1068(-)
MVTLTLFSGATATLCKHLLKTKVPVSVKSFHGTRKVYTVDIPPDKTVGDLKDMLLKADTEGDLKGFIQIGLYCPIVFLSLPLKGKLRELDIYDRIADCGITHKTLLILMGVKHFTWDSSRKGNDIEVLL